MVKNVSFGNGVPQIPYPMGVQSNPFCYYGSGYGQPPADCYCGDKGVTAGGILKGVGLLTGVGVGLYLLFKKPEEGKSYFKMLKNDIGEMKIFKDIKETKLWKKVSSWFEKEKPDIPNPNSADDLAGAAG